MLEHKKVTLKEFLKNELDHSIKCRPDVKIADGAKDNWAFFGKTLPEGISVLDFYHAAEHLKKAFEIIIQHLSYQLEKHPKKEMNYFKNNKQRCRYLNVSEANLPIGSGIVEATCKSLVSQRLKRSGMCWKESGGQTILTFRALLQSGLFDSAWEMLSKEYFFEIKLPKNVIPFPRNKRKTVSG